MRLRELASSRPRYGYRRLWILLVREGFQVGHKLVYRLYKEEGLQIRPRRRRKAASETRLDLPQAASPNERWSMDFVSDSFADGRRFRVFAVIDQFTRECLVLHPGVSLGARDLTKTLAEAVRIRGRPKAITCDNGSEFTSRHFDAWAYEEGIQIDFIRPGKPVENALIESFNARFREECLSQSWFQSLVDAQAASAAWMQDYNESRPHSSLGDLAPAEYAAKLLLGPGFEEVA